MSNTRIMRLIRGSGFVYEVETAYGAHELHTRLDGVRQRYVMPVLV